MDENWALLGIIAMLCSMSVAKAYFNSKNKHFIAKEIERLQQRVEALERRGP